jgi:hypothetical protein
MLFLTTTLNCALAFNVFDTFSSTSIFLKQKCVEVRHT